MGLLLAHSWLQVQGHWERSIALYRTNAVYVLDSDLRAAEHCCGHFELVDGLHRCRKVQQLHHPGEGRPQGPPLLLSIACSQAADHFFRTTCRLESCRDRECCMVCSRPPSLCGHLDEKRIMPEYARRSNTAA